MKPAAFAAKIGVPASTVYRWLYGIRTPRVQLVAAIEEATGGEVTAKDFLSPPTSPTPAQPTEAA